MTDPRNVLTCTLCGAKWGAPLADPPPPFVCTPCVQQLVEERLQDRELSCPPWRGVRDNREQVSLLAQAFPSLRGRAGVRPFDPEVLSSREVFGVMSSGAKHAARFVLTQVWNSDPKVWPRYLGRFNVRDAFGTWDDAHRAAFSAWCKEPFFP